MAEEKAAVRRGTGVPDAHVRAVKRCGIGEAALARRGTVGGSGGGAPAACRHLKHASL
jgi:hypothetical protein